MDVPKGRCAASLFAAFDAVDLTQICRKRYEKILLGMGRFWTKPAVKPTVFNTLWRFISELATRNSSPSADLPYILCESSPETTVSGDFCYVKHSKNLNVPFPRPFGATGSDARTLHAHGFACFRGVLSAHEVLCLKVEIPLYRLSKSHSWNTTISCVLSQKTRKLEVKKWLR